MTSAHPDLLAVAKNKTNWSFSFFEGRRDSRHLVILLSDRRSKTLDRHLLGEIRVLTNSAVLLVESDDTTGRAYLVDREFPGLPQSLRSELITYLRKTPFVLHESLLIATGMNVVPALLAAVQMKIEDVIAVSPQLSQDRIADELNAVWPGQRDLVEIGSRLLENALRNIRPSRFNYYEISRAGSPVAPDFIQAIGLNRVSSDSTVLSDDADLVAFNSALIASVISQCALGVAPRIGMLQSGSRPLTGTWTPGSRTCVASLEFTKTMGSRLYPVGTAYISGLEASRYGAQTVSLVMDDGHSVELFALGSLESKELSKQECSSFYTDYSVAGFASFAHQGIDLSLLPTGKYRLGLEVSNSGQTARTFQLPSNVDKTWTHGESLYQISYTGGEVILTKRSLDDCAVGDEHFHADEFEIRSGRIFTLGTFAVRHCEMRNWTDGQYFLVLEGPETISIPLAKAQRAKLPVRFTEDPFDYSKSYFATPRYEGVEIPENSVPGVYRVSVCFLHGSALFRHDLVETVTVTGEFSNHSTKRTERTSVSIVGSCVTRDNFNNQLSSNWREFFTLDQTHYQMSLVSLMSGPSSLTPDDLDGMNDHDRSMTERDHTKAFLTEFAERASSILIVDLFADARFPVIKMEDDRYITDNAWKLPNASAYYHHLADLPRLGMESNEDEYLPVFERAVENFRDFVFSVSPSTVILLNRARAVNEYEQGGKRIWFGRKGVEALNSRWKKLDDVFTEIVNPVVIDPMSRGLRSDPNHPWGPASVHYESRYYEGFRKLLLARLGYTPRLAR